MVQRYMTTETEKQAQKSVLTNAILTIPATLLFFFVGTVLYVYYKHNPTDLSLTITDGDAILPWYIYSQLPQGVTGLLISGIFAAAMSTLSSSMNSAATAYIVDIHGKIIKKEAIIMDMYPKRKIRAEKKKDDSPKSFPSVGINWESTNYLNTSQNH